MRLNQLTIILTICTSLLLIACSQGNQNSNQTNSNQAISNQTVSGGGKTDQEPDFSKDNSAIKSLSGNDEKLRQKTLEEVLNKPNDYNPVVLCVVSRELFKQEKRDEAAFWFYTCQLRARIDSNLSTDKSTGAALDRISQIFGPEINKYAFNDMDKLEKTVNKTVEFVGTNEENYDRRWIYNSGLKAMGSALEDYFTPNSKNKTVENPLKPKAEWAAIKKETIDNYSKGFLEAKKKMEAQNLLPDK